MLIIDRFEGEYAVVEEDGDKMTNILRKHIATDAKEGDCIKIVDGKYIIDHEETKKRKDEIEQIAKDLWN